MSDMLSTGVSGLLAFQTALDTISNNISNVNTPGYSGETTNLVTNSGHASSARLDRQWRLGRRASRAPTTSFLPQQTNGATSSYNQLNTL